MENLLFYLIIGMVSLALGLGAGLSSVFVFNNLPGAWFDNALAKGDTLIRIRKQPWAWLIGATFTVVLVYMAVFSWQYALGCGLLLWVLTLGFMSAAKYDEVPMALTALALMGVVVQLPFNDSYMSMVYGALVSVVAALVILIVGKATKKREAYLESLIIAASMGASLGLEMMKWAVPAGAFLWIISLMLKMQKGQKRGSWLNYTSGLIVVYMICLVISGR